MTVWFRGKPACECLAEWLPALEAELLRRAVIRESIDIYQLIGGAAASGGTHATGGAFDIVQRDPVTIWVARQMGADATWARTTMSPPHAHGVLTGCPHNGPAAYQITEVRAGGDGLLGSAPDTGPRPLSGRTWREGIAWARQQQPTEEEQLMSVQDEIEAAIKASEKRIVERIGGAEKRGRDRDIRIADRIAKKVGKSRDQILAEFDDEDA